MVHAFHNTHRTGITKTTAAILLATTFIGASATHADDKKKLKVTIENKTSVTVIVNSGPIKDYQVASQHNPQVDADIDSKASSISWEASTKNSKTKCDSGTANVKDGKATITVKSASCVDKPAEEAG
jgi:hypothetical protein